jgi:hypothetical protein
MIKVDENLIGLIRLKGGAAKDATDATYAVFTTFKKLLSETEKALIHHVKDERIKIRYHDNGTFESELKIADDILIFLMYTNALVFDPAHPIAKSSYVTGDQRNGVCGMISIYNFLSDSFKYERRNDVGQLVARIFVNHDRHFFMEGKKQLGVIFNNFSTDIITDEAVLKIIEKSIKYSIEADTLAPSFDIMKEISVNDVMEFSLLGSIASGKRLGFRLDSDPIEPVI